MALQAAARASARKQEQRRIGGIGRGCAPRDDEGLMPLGQHNCRSWTYSRPPQLAKYPLRHTCKNGHLNGKVLRTSACRPQPPARPCSSAAGRSFTLDNRAACQAAVSILSIALKKSCNSVIDPSTGACAHAAPGRRRRAPIGAAQPRYSRAAAPSVESVVSIFWFGQRETSSCRRAACTVRSPRQLHVCKL